ncbi:mismatch-specific DNA-glycosylase [Fulvivirga maritima]|uniref:mismatch-specific DNA-glycosylase n=1 Tax=Fulvivirga maritima TaxID=2904247 RepID=UPI001F2A0472|nr:mismatch-specific DNA-glycosylase [Fulvivirga maritima]UII26123.1 mismatch-specific DNA-glycosylase [Fulvivirga maritima]
MFKDVLTHNLDVVFCGTAKGTASFKKGFYYAGPGNKFYDILYQAGFTNRKLEPKDCFQINQYRIGLTDLVHTQYVNDNEVSDDSYEVDNFIDKILAYQPKYVAFNSKKGASFVLGYGGVTKHVKYGLQEKTIGESKIFVLPSTSGSARRYWDEEYWFQLKQLIIDK